MTFFNKKTDVIDIELTPYGRYLLSVGKLKPKYYDFCDDDILYDIAAARGEGAISEGNENAHDRIVSNTPKLKTLYLTKGVESDSQENFSSQQSMNIQIDDVRVMDQEVSYNQRGLMPLGRSSYASQRAPSFQVTMLRGEITGSMTYLSSSSQGETIVDSLPIPQVDVDFVVTATIASALTEPPADDDFASGIFNGEYVKLTFESPIIHLKEFGSFYEKENFEIEVFEINDYEYNSKIGGVLSNVHITGQAMSPKKFVAPINNIVNDILLDVKEIDAAEELFGDSLTKDMVSYYFDIEVDSEISQEELCAATSGLEINNQFLDEELICPDQRTERFNIYTSRVTPDDLEDCD